MQASSAATKTEKKNLLAWEAKEIAGMNYRIRFRRYNPEQEGPSDTAFYFERQEEVYSFVDMQGFNFCFSGRR